MEETESTPLDAESKPPKPPRNWAGSESAVRVADLFVGAVAITLVFWLLQRQTQAICCGDFDGYYHIKWARLLWENMRAKHFPPAFTWLPLTTLNPRDYVDHHLLFHIILIPFTWFRDLQTGAKVAAVVFASLAVLSCYWLVVRYEIRSRLIWLLAPQPDQPVTNFVAHHQPVTGKDGQAGENNRGHLRPRLQIAKPRERNQNDVKEQVVIDVIAGIQRRQRQPGKGGWEMLRAHVFPKQARPFDVIVAVKVAAADRLSLALQQPEHQRNCDRPDEEIGDAHRGF